MTSELSGVAARVRELISRGAEDRHTPRHDEFNTLAFALFALQFEHNAAYRKFCQARKSFPAALRHWTQIPAVPAAAFKELELTCLSARERSTVFHSSGTTAQRPSRHLHSAESLALYEASLWPWFRAHVASQIANSRSPIADGSAVILTPPAAQVPHSSLVHMFEFVRRNLGWSESAFVGETSGDGSWTLNCDAALETLREAKCRDQPAMLLGTAFSFVHLLNVLSERNWRLQLPPGSRVMETGGYKGRSRSLPKPELHGLITERLGIPATHIVSEYGMSELSSQAYDVSVPRSGFRVPSYSHAGTIRNSEPGTRNFHFPPWARTRIISPETGREVAEGETGLLQVFDLANVFSVMAVQTEDLAIRRGDGFELVGRATAAEPRGCSLMLQDACAPGSNHKT